MDFALIDAFIDYKILVFFPRSIIKTLLKPALKTSVNYNIYEESCIFFYELQGINFAQVNNMHFKSA